MKEDVLEQLMEDYLHQGGYFTMHNVKYRPDKGCQGYNASRDSVHSDIDILAINPKKIGYDRVVAISCKSWQGGFDPSFWIKQIKRKGKISGRAAWKSFREIANDKWASAFRKKIAELTGTKRFTLRIVATKVTGGNDACSEFEKCGEFRKRLGRNPIEIRLLSTILHELNKRGAAMKTNTPASSDIGRLLQVIRASGFKLNEDGKAMPKGKAKPLKNQRK